MVINGKRGLRSLLVLNSDVDFFLTIPRADRTKILLPNLGCDRLVAVFLRSALQRKFFPFPHTTLFDASVVMNHLSVYQLFLLTSEFQGISPLIEHARNLTKK